MLTPESSGASNRSWMTAPAQIDVTSFVPAPPGQVQSQRPIQKSNWRRGSFGTGHIGGGCYGRGATVRLHEVAQLPPSRPAQEVRALIAVPRPCESMACRQVERRCEFPHLGVCCAPRSDDNNN